MSWLSPAIISGSQSVNLLDELCVLARKAEVFHCFLAAVAEGVPPPWGHQFHGKFCTTNEPEENKIKKFNNDNSNYGEERQDGKRRERGSDSFKVQRKNLKEIVRAEMDGE